MKNQHSIRHKRKQNRDSRFTQLGFKRGGHWDSGWYGEDEIVRDNFEIYNKGQERDLFDVVVKGYVTEEGRTEENKKVHSNEYEKKYPKSPHNNV